MELSYYGLTLGGLLPWLWGDMVVSDLMPPLQSLGACSSAVVSQGQVCNSIQECLTAICGMTNVSSMISGKICAKELSSWLKHRCRAVFLPNFWPEHSHQSFSCSSPLCVTISDICFFTSAFLWRLRCRLSLCFSSRLSDLRRSSSSSLPD